MSIINEALKKVGKQIEKKVDSGEEKPLPTKPGILPTPQININIMNSDRKKGPNLISPRTIIMGICVLVLAFIAVLIVSLPHKKKQITYSQGAVLPNPNPALAPEAMPVQPALPESAPLPFGKIFEPTSGRSSFRLSGIMLSEEGPVAIINNEIVKQGDAIGGATVESIDEEQVKLSYQGQEIILTVK